MFGARRDLARSSGKGALQQRYDLAYKLGKPDGRDLACAAIGALKSLQASDLTSLFSELDIVTPMYTIGTPLASLSMDFRLPGVQ